MTNCATTHAPSNWLSEPESVASEPFGGWIEIKSHGNYVRGELIAINEDTIFVANDTLHTVASKDVLSARLVTYHASSMGWYVPGGIIFTITNGWFLLLTAPMWLIGGSIAAVARSHRPIMDYPKSALADFKPFARFPQGLPSSLDRGAVRMKAVRKE